MADPRDISNQTLVLLVLSLTEAFGDSFNIVYTLPMNDSFARAFKKSFDPTLNAPLEAWEYVVALGEVLNFKKNQIIKEAHTIEKHGYFLIKGSCGLFICKDSSNVCLDIFLEDSFFADNLSLSTGESSPIEIMALENSKIIRISKTNIEHLKQTPMGKNLFFLALQQDLADKQNQQVEYLTKTAEERYIDLIHDKPELLNRIPQKFIASYLGITTQSLSRIRKKIIGLSLLFLP